MKLSQDDTTTKATTTTKPDNKENEAAAEAAEAPTTVATTRPENSSIPREEEYRRKWGVYPREYTGGCFVFRGCVCVVGGVGVGGGGWVLIDGMRTYISPNAITDAGNHPNQRPNRPQNQYNIYIRTIIIYLKNYNTHM